MFGDLIGFRETSPMGFKTVHVFGGVFWFSTSFAASSDRSGGPWGANQ